VNRKKDDLGLGLTACQQTCGFQTIQHPHGYIDYYDIRPQRVRGLKKGLTVMNGANHLELRFQDTARGLQHRWVVIG
jgi:hypothetical protein